MSQESDNHANDNDKDHKMSPEEAERNLKDYKCYLIFKSYYDEILKKQGETALIPMIDKAYSDIELCKWQLKYTPYIFIGGFKSLISS